MEGAGWTGSPGSRRTSDAYDAPERKGTYDVSAVLVGLGFSVDFGRSHPATRPAATSLASR